MEVSALVVASGGPAGEERRGWSSGGRMFRARTEKISFAEAEEFVRSGRLEGLGRSLQQEEHYSEQTSQLKREWSSVSDYILHDKFAFVSKQHH